MKTETSKKLWWSEQGQIACEEHMPYRGSDTFAWGRWRPIRFNESIDFAAELDHAPECETCAAIARRSRGVDHHG